MTAGGAGPFAGRVAVVTGGARGIGAATVRALLEGGARVCSADLDVGDDLPPVDPEHADSLVRIGGDLAEPDAAARLVGAAEEHFGPPDILVNNAGYYWDATIHRMTDEQLEAMLEIHIMVPFRLMREVIRRWRELGHSDELEDTYHRKIVNVTSRAAFKGLPGGGNYAAAKAGLVGLTYTAARECGRYPINVNAVSFGPVRTRFSASAADGTTISSGGRSVPLGRATRPDGPSGDPAAPLTAPRRPTISGRAATPAEAANTIAFLCSQQSNTINGEVVNVNN